MLVRLRSVVVLLLLVMAASFGLASPARADTCTDSPYDFRYSVRSLTLSSTSSFSYVGDKAVISVSVTASPDSNSDIQPLCVFVDWTSGDPNKQPTQFVLVTISGGQGTGSFSYSGSATGVDHLNGSTPDAAAQPSSKTLAHEWRVKPSPTPSPTPKKTPSPKPSATKSPTTSPTPSPTPKKTTSPAPATTTSAIPSPTPSATVTPTAAPSGTTSPTPAPATSLDPGAIHLNTPSTLPGGDATVSGTNCPAGSTVSFSVEGTPAGSSTANPDGTFGGNVQLPDASIGEHEIQVTCQGRTATVPIDLVVSSSSTSSPAAGATAAAVLAFFLLLGSVLLTRNHGGKRARSES